MFTHDYVKDAVDYWKSKANEPFYSYICPKCKQLVSKNGTLTNSNHPAFCDYKYTGDEPDYTPFKDFLIEPTNKDRR